jgi:hypothetical protein
LSPGPNLLKNHEKGPLITLFFGIPDAILEFASFS